METRRNSVLIWGAGQHGRVVAEIARAAGHEVLGYIDADPHKRSKVADAAGARVVLFEPALLRSLQRGMFPAGVDAVIPAIGDNRTRLMHARLLGPLLSPAIVHPTAFVSPSAILMGGTVVGPMAVVNTNARIGRAVIINSAAVVGHDTEVGDGAHICACVVLTGGVHVGSCSFVGCGANVIPEVKVGSGVVVGAGTVVLRDVPDGYTIAGVPARVIGSKHDKNINEADLPLAAPTLGT